MSPSLQLGSLVVAEPATVITDIILAASSWWFARRLHTRDSSLTRRWWSRAFAFIGAGALAGGVWHGFHNAMPPVVDSSLWRLCLLLTLGSSLCLWQAAATGFPPQKPPDHWQRLGWIKGLACAAMAMVRPEFVIVLADFAASMVFLSARVLATGGRPGSRHLLCGVGLFACGGVVQAAAWAPHAAFNHNDLFHVIQLAGNWLMYEGARRASAGPILVHS